MEIRVNKTSSVFKNMQKKGNKKVTAFTYCTRNMPGKKVRRSKINLFLFYLVIVFFKANTYFGCHVATSA